MAKDRKYEILDTMFKGNLVKYAQRYLHYSDSNILILEGDENGLKEKYPDVYNNILSCSHQMDSRTPMEYAKCLVASWIFEDFVVRRMNECGIETRLAGADNQREFLKYSDVSNDSDMCASVNGKDIKIELITDFTNFWERNNIIDLRDDKFNKLKNNDSYLLCIIPEKMKFDFFKVDDSLNAEYTSYHPYWHKPAYRVKINNGFTNLTMPNIINKINQVINATVNEKK